MIRKLASGEYRLYSRKVDPKTRKRRNLGTFDSLENAKTRTRSAVFQAALSWWRIINALAPTPTHEEAASVPIAAPLRAARAIFGTLPHLATGRHHTRKLHKRNRRNLVRVYFPRNHWWTAKISKPN